ncbi:MAG: RidA family protein [Chitinophagales bacterium]|jgi:enamine deaminase RidA (YjgF/YER057c/UK114 family)|nr:RidA family protein [Chitinophagales bacterium]
MLKVSSGTKWEDIVGYSRAVRVGNMVFVAGTTAVDGLVVVGEGNIYQQTHFIITKIEKALQQCGASLANVVQTRMYVTNINQWEQVAKAHSEFFDTIRPAATMVEVSALAMPQLLIEIEVIALIEV